MSIHHSRYDSKLTDASTRYTHTTYKSFSPLPTMPSTFSPLSLTSKKKTKVFLLNNTMANSPNVTMKKLNIWDKEHIKEHKENVFTIYNKLSSFYVNKKLIKEKSKLDGLNSLLQSKINYNHLMQKGKKSNKILDEFYKSGNKEQGSILSNNISHTKTKFNVTLSVNTTQKAIKNDFNIDENTLVAMHENNNGSEYYRKVIKEKIKYENQLREELVNLSRDIYNKKQEKKELENKLSEIYLQRSKLISTFNKINNKIKKELLDLKDVYDRQVKNATHIRGSVTFTKEQMKVIGETQTKNYELDKKLSKLKEEYEKNIKENTIERDDIAQKIKVTDSEIEYYKQVNDELIKEQRGYYLKILSKGIDSREEGLIWVVRRLLEIDTTLEYCHFPKFLTHSQDDYLITIGKLSLEEIQLKIILKALKKKQLKLRVDENIKKFNKVNDYLVRIAKEEELKNKVEMKVNKERLNIESKVKAKIDKKLNKIYEHHEKAFKLFQEKKEEDSKMERIAFEIRQKLLGRYCGNEENIINYFLKNENHKEMFNLIIYTRNKVEELRNQRESLSKAEIQKFKENEENEKHNINSNLKQSMQFELVKRSLFGDNIQV